MFENQPPPRPAVLLVVAVVGVVGVGVGVRHSHDLPLISLEITENTYQHCSRKTKLQSYTILSSESD